MNRFIALIAASVLVFAAAASGYAVGPPATLEKLATDADLIFKATAVSSAAVQDDWFKPCPGFAARETRFTLISVIKGAPQGAPLRFRHYDESPQAPGVGRSYEPQYYHFIENRTYIVFAKKTDDPAIYRQLRPNHTGIKEQGALLCLDDKPVAAEKLKDSVWSELLAMVRSPEPKDTLYAIRQLDQMSGLPGRFEATEDFDRTDVLKAIGPLMTQRDDEIARAAITAIGSNNPYLADERAQYWLATVGGAEVPGIGKMDPKMQNAGGELFRKQLISIADGKAPTVTRALAIRALGLVRNRDLLEPLIRWLKDPEPALRASTALLLADFPDDGAVKILTSLAADPAPEVRWCAAHAIGFIQRPELAKPLGELLVDNDPKVRRAASLSLLSFSPQHEAIAKVFEANLKNEEFSPLFLNALAGEKPEAYLEPLAQAVEQKTAPRNWPGGQVPAFTAFNILFKYLQSQPADAVRAGKFDRYLNAIEKGYVTGSSEPRDIYAFYLQRSMTDRAKIYRAAANKAASYDLDYYFIMVDQSPSTYTR